MKVGTAITSGPFFEQIAGNGQQCDVNRCTNPGMYIANWPFVSKYVCETHKRKVDGQPWNAVATLFRQSQSA